MLQHRTFSHFSNPQPNFVAYQIFCFLLPHFQKNVLQKQLDELIGASFFRETKGHCTYLFLSSLAHSSSQSKLKIDKSLA